MSDEIGVCRAGVKLVCITPSLLVVGEFWIPYLGSGRRGLALNKIDYESVKNLDGRFREWIQTGYSVATRRMK
jgi:hypothetical protein